MREIILCKYGEIALKGANRAYFEDLLRKNLKRRVGKFGKFSIYALQSTVYIEPQSEDCDIASAYEAAKATFGVVAVSRAYELPKNMSDIIAAVPNIIPSIKTHTFKVDAKRSDKSFPLGSPEICAEVGAEILSLTKGKIKVDVHNPETVVRVEIRDKNAYLCAGQEKAVGGMPVGSNGTGLLLLSGGIDSPVSGYMMAKRGVKIEALHFESFPYTSERARMKVISLAEEIAEYCGDINVHIISLTHIQEELRDKTDEDYFTLLLRRFMMRLACRTAQMYGCEAVITGESLGQVASQTMQALCVTNIEADRPVFRPCIGMDKEEIVQISRKIGTFDTSILPYEDCCTVFTSRHPRTRLELDKVLEQEAKVDVRALEDGAFDAIYTITAKRK
ncbi:MAG: tRNA 4-thiouridine(8) synthase ThiI [Clostridiales bacterium]|nr:tRNA 4-thiouridine(8) synthase ThiI [Clostridiales bacterium]